MFSFRHALHALQLATPPPRHMTARMTTDELANLPKGLSLTRIMEACERRGIDPHEVIAIALSDDMRQQAESSGMTMKAQADLAWKLIDKAEPSKKALDIDANVKGTVQIGIISFADIDPASMEAKAVSASNVAGA